MTVKKLTYYFLAMLGALLATACSAVDDFDGAVAGDSGEFNLRLFLDASAAPVSRAPEEGYEPGVDYENYLEIDGGDFRVALFSADDEWLLTVHPSYLTLAAATEGAVGSKRYTLDIKVDAEVGKIINADESVKVVILANWRDNYPALTTGSRLDELFAQAREIAYTKLPVGDLTSAADRIPMFGVTQFTGVYLRDGVVATLGNIHLLRALAKVEVIDDRYTSLNITGVRLTRHTTAAAPMPKGVTHQNHYVKGSYAGDYVKYPSFPVAWGSTPGISDEPVELKKDKNGSWVVYLPEFDNTGQMADDEHIRLELSFENLDNTDFIDFKYYSDTADGGKEGEYFDVLRNNIYRFTVKKNAHGLLYPTVDIIPYSAVLLNPDFGLERDPINGWMVFRNEAGYLLCYYDEETHSFYDSDYQKITFSSKDDTPSWLEVTNSQNEFAWYFDVETGKMYDAAGVELTGLTRHSTTGWLVKYIPGTDQIDYYLDPLSIAIYDRNRNEVELETPEATGAYKYLRDADSHILVRFDAITGKIYNADGTELTLSHDDNGRTELRCPDDKSIYSRYDRATGYFYDENGVRVKNPFSNPGWTPFRYSNGSLICFYDQVTGKFYDSDLDEITFEIVQSHPWLRVVDHDGNFIWNFDYESGRLYNEAGREMTVERDRTTGNIIRRDSKGEIAYYLNPIALTVYDTNQQIIRLTHQSDATNALKVLSYTESAGGGPVHYYFDAASGKLYNRNMTEIPFGSLSRNSKGHVVMNNDAGNLFRYYDVKAGQFYTSIGIPVSNPFCEHTFDDVITPDGKFVCFYYQDENRFTDGYGRTLTWELVTSDSHNPWFKVVDTAGNFFWNVDIFTMKLYNANGVEITSPNISNTTANKRVTSGRIDARTGRVEYIYTGTAANYYTTAYWLDPVSLVVYDREMCEILLPRESTKTQARQKFTDGTRDYYSIDVLTRLIYKNGSPVNMYGTTQNLTYEKPSSTQYFFWFRATNGNIYYGYRVDTGVFYKTTGGGSPVLSTSYSSADKETHYNLCSNPSNPFLDQL